MKKKILIIDDELGEINSQAYRISQTLQDRGFEILSCVSFKWEDISKIIKDNYRSLRLILCDLQDSQHDSLAGWNIISIIKAPNNRNLIDNNDWFIECIPIIVITQTKDYHEERKSHGNEYVTLFDKAACQGEAFKGCVDILTNLFDKLCQEKMRFKVAISYTWYNKKTNEKHQPFVEFIAHRLYQEYKKDRVFFDEDKTSKTAGTKSDELVKNIYGKGCDFVLIFLSNDYATSGWTKKEWEQTKNRGDNKYLFIAIDELEKTTVAQNLFPNEWRAEVSENNNEEEKEQFYNNHLPLYIDCHKEKEMFDSSRKVHKITEHYEFIKTINSIIEDIIDNIKTRI